MVNSTEDPTDAFDQVVEIANHHDARLTLLMVVNPIPAYVNRLTPFTIHKTRVKRIKEQFRHLKARHAGLQKVETKILIGTPFIRIIQQVLSLDHDLVVKSTEDERGMVAKLFSSTDMHLLRNCPCPV